MKSMQPKHRTRLLALLFGTACFLIAQIATVRRFQQAPSSGDADKCSKLVWRPQTPEIPTFENPRVKHTETILLKNCHVWDGLGNEFHADILLQDGIIREVKPAIEPSPIAKVIDVRGAIVTPGLIDMHSHTGMDTWPSFEGTSDTNEMTNPIFPQLRAVDAFNPHDASVRLISAGGVTTSLILPGSGNIMGGEALLIKHVAKKTVKEMGFYNGAEDSNYAFRFMKMAMGENPKRSYGTRTPGTRMGSAWLMRQVFKKASKLKGEQDEYCERLPVGEHFPEDLSLESLIALLRGQVKLNVHVYETHDIETLFRIADEFNVPVSAIHHATSAHLLAEYLSARDNLTVALFSDRGFYKVEAFHASFKAPSILRSANVSIAFKSDHSVTNAQFLHWQAAKGVYFGLSAQEALVAITSSPAKALGISHRVGSIHPGKDADIVVWSKNPMRDIGALPNYVIIDGSIAFEASNKSFSGSNSETSSQELGEQGLCDELVNATSNSKKVFLLLDGFTHVHINKSTEFVNTSVLIKFDKLQNYDDEIVAKDAQVLCVGHCRHELASYRNRYPNATVLKKTLNKAVMMPSAIAVSSNLGLVEISQEDVTHAGAPDLSIWDSLVLDGGLSVSAGIQTGLGHGKSFDYGYSKSMEIASRSGVGFALVLPTFPGEGMVMGKSAVLRTAAPAGNFLDTGGIVLDDIGIHIALGREVRGDLLNAVEGQLEYLKKLLERAIDEEAGFENNTDISRENDFVKVLKGSMPLFVHVNNAEEISSVLRIKREIEKVYDAANIKLVIFGGAEAWILAKELAEENVSVILAPLLSTPERYEARRTRSYSSLENPVLTGRSDVPPQAVNILRSNGVKFAVVGDEVHETIWAAGWARVMSNQLIDGSETSTVKMSLHDAVGLTTWSAAELLMLDQTNVGSIDIRQSLANFLIYTNGHPLEHVDVKLSLAVSTKGNFALQHPVHIRCAPINI